MWCCFFCGCCVSSPISWAYTFFQEKNKENDRYHTIDAAPDVYVLLSLIVLPIWLWLVPMLPGPAWITPVLAGLLVIDIFQTLIFVIVVRPLVDPSYKQFNRLRSFLLAIIPYFNLATLFAILYYSVLRNSFDPALTQVAAWALSVGIITSTGFSGITPAGGIARIVCGIESLIGIFFISTIIALAASRLATNVPEVE